MSKLVMMVLAMAVGFIMACDTGPFDAINDGPGPLPGDCNNPVLCGSTPHPGDGNGSGGTAEQCSGCDCAPSPQECRSCTIRCRRALYNCYGSTGTSAEGCDLVYGQSCENACTRGATTCTCPK